MQTLSSAPFHCYSAGLKAAMVKHKISQKSVIRGKTAYISTHPCYVRFLFAPLLRGCHPSNRGTGLGHLDEVVGE
jgi:hypothetical protein